MTHNTYVTMGQIHEHEIAGKHIDKDTVAVLECNGPQDGRWRAFTLFGPQFSFEFFEDAWRDEKMEYFPKGYVHLSKDDQQIED